MSRRKKKNRRAKAPRDIVREAKRIMDEAHPFVDDPKSKQLLKHKLKIESDPRNVSHDPGCELQGGLGTCTCQLFISI